MPITRAATPARSGVPRAGRGPRPHRALAHEHHRGRAVVHAGRVARRDGSTSRKAGLSSRERLQRGVGRGCSSAATRHSSPGYSTGTISAARRLRRPLPSAAMAAQSVLLLAGDAVALGEVLRGLAHDQVADRTSKPSRYIASMARCGRAGSPHACRAAGTEPASCSPCRRRALPRLSPSRIAARPVGGLHARSACDVDVVGVTSFGTPARMLTWRPVLGPLPAWRAWPKIV